MRWYPGLVHFPPTWRACCCLRRAARARGPQRRRPPVGVVANVHPTDALARSPSPFAPESRLNVGVLYVWWRVIQLLARCLSPLFARLFAGAAWAAWCAASHRRAPATMRFGAVARGQAARATAARRRAARRRPRLRRYICRPRRRSLWYTTWAAWRWCEAAPAMVCATTCQNALPERVIGEKVLLAARACVAPSG